MKDDTILCTKQTARLLGLSPRTLEQQRLRGRGLPYHKVGRQVRYLLSDVVAYLQAHRYEPSGFERLAA